MEYREIKTGNQKSYPGFTRELARGQRSLLSGSDTSDTEPLGYDLLILLWSCTCGSKAGVVCFIPSCLLTSVSSDPDILLLCHVKVGMKEGAGLFEEPGKCIS